MANKPYGVDQENRVLIPDGAKSLGAEANNGIFNEYMNQILFEAQCDHIWGNQSQVTADPATATFYTNYLGAPLLATGGAPIISEDDKILIRHDTTQTADLVLAAGGVRITLEMYGGVTLDMGTHDLTLGEAGDSIGGGIRITQTANLTINGNRGLKVNNSAGVYDDFKAKNLIINTQSNTTVDVDADNIIFVDNIGGGARINNINETFDITTDLMSGTSEKSSTWYQLWLDSAGVRMMVPDIVSVADGNTPNKLVDSSADFVTDKVQVGDIAYNLDDLTSGAVTAVDDLNTLSFATDLFPDGNENYKIRMLSPVGIGDFKAMVGAAYNNSSSNITDSTYTQVQEPKLYIGDGTDFAITSNPAVVSLIEALAYVYQTNDWTGKGSWHINFQIAYGVSPAARVSIAMTMSGVSFLSTSSFFQVCGGHTDTPAVNITAVETTPGSGTVTLYHANAGITNYYFSGDCYLDKKPTFAN